MGDVWKGQHDEIEAMETVEFCTLTDRKIKKIV